MGVHRCGRERVGSTASEHCLPELQLVIRPYMYAVAMRNVIIIARLRALYFYLPATLSQLKAFTLNM